MVAPGVAAPADVFQDAPALLDVPNPFRHHHGRVRVLERAGCSVGEIHRRLLAGSYGRPFIIEDEETRALHFSLAFIQSAMRLDEPDGLDLRYTQKMMGFLLFQPAPQTLLMLGLGGGSLAKFCYRQLPQADITVIEIDPDVLALRPHFMVPADDARFRVLQADGATQLDARRGEVDVLLVDAFDASGLAPSLANYAFLHDAWQALSPQGVLVMNLAGDKRQYVELLADIMTIFDQQILLLSVHGDGNTILFGFKQPGFEPDWRQLKERARELKLRHGLEFPVFVQKMQKLHAEQPLWARHGV